MASPAAPAPSPTPASGPSELAANWPLLLACIICMPMPMLTPYAYGQLLGPVEAEFGWSRTEASIGLTVSMVAGFLVSPLVGRLVDLVNARLLALPGIVLVGLSLASFSLATESKALWTAIWCANALFGALVSPTVFLTVINGAFDKQRSLATSIALCGTSIASGFGPVLCSWLIGEFGWRSAMQIAGLVWALPPMLLALLFFRDRRDLARPPAHAKGMPAAGSGLKAAYLSVTFLSLAGLTFLITVANGAYMLHLAPAMMDNGFAPALAAMLAGVTGFASIAGKLGVGGLYDRLGHARASLLFAALIALAYGLLALGSTTLLPAIIACVFLGVGGGAFIALLTCVTSRFFPQAIFGAIFGALMSLTALASAVGPLLASAVHDATDSYRLAFLAGIGVAAVVALVLPRLRKFEPA